MRPVVSLPIVVAALASAGCVPHYVQYARPAAPAEVVVAPESSPEQEWTAATQAVSAAQVPIATEDPANGVIETQWQETFTRFSAASPPTRRLRFRITVQPGRLDVVPMPEICVAEDACRPTDDLTEAEATLADRLVASLRGSVAQLVPPATAPATGVAAEPPPAVSLQSGREVAPPPPPPPAPTLIRTRSGGLQEVDVGKEVEIDLVDGHRITGRVIDANAQQIRVDAGTGPEGIVVHAYDVDRIVAQ